MKTRMFYTTGRQDICEMEWDKPEPKDNEIEVKNIFTGVCRSDIEMYKGNFTLPSRFMQGHEGLGEVTKVGKDVILIREGDIVATRGEPSFADYYNAELGTFVVVPEALPKYILEPVACGLNIFNTTWGCITDESKILILGTGFLAQVVYEAIQWHNLYNDITIIGNANKDYWQGKPIYGNFDALRKYGHTFDVIVDLSDKPEYMKETGHIEEEAFIILAAEKNPELILPMADLLWKAVTVCFPSPRNKAFIHAMEISVELVEKGIIDTASMWTQGYDRNTEVKDAFEDGLNRKEGYSRGYIRW